MAIFDSMLSMARIKRFLPFLLIASIAFSCVPERRVAEIQAKLDQYIEDNDLLSSNKQDCEAKLKEAQASVEDLSKQVTALKTDTTTMGTSLRKMVAQYDKLNRINDELLSKQRQSMATSEAENRKLMRELLQAQEDLQRKEDMLRQLERDLNKKQAELEALEADLQEREKRVKELQRIIDEKDRAVRELKERIQEALLGFKDKGLSVETKNGRIQVSMEAKMLFPSGSTVINEEGKKALIDLAKVLEDQKDLTILVEGHTDTDEFRGRGEIKDNWDLSVMRSTAVVKIMLQNSKINASTLTAAGRGEFVPVDDAGTAEAKAKNRRIEIILTPNLDQLFEILEN
jgi:chemotaxis protein MotB